MATHEHQTTFDWSGEMPIHKPTLAEKNQNLPPERATLHKAVTMERKPLFDLLQFVANVLNVDMTKRQKAADILMKFNQLTDDQIAAEIEGLGIDFREHHLPPHIQIGFLVEHTAWKGLNRENNPDIA